LLLEGTLRIPRAEKVTLTRDYSTRIRAGPLISISRSQKMDTYPTRAKILVSAPLIKKLYTVRSKLDLLGTGYRTQVPKNRLKSFPTPKRIPPKTKGQRPQMFLKLKTFTARTMSISALSLRRSQFFLLSCQY